MWKFSIEDEALAKQVLALIGEHKKKLTLEKRKARTSYAKRLKEFVSSCCYDIDGDKSIGLATWYGATGSSLLKIDGVEILDVEWSNRRIPTGMTFSGRHLAKHFRPGEDLPCIMRGSLFGIRKLRELSGTPQYDMPLNVIERWLRRTKYTCLNPQEWRDLRESDDGRKFVDRVLSKWGIGQGWGSRDHFDQGLRILVNEYGGERTVLLRGQTRHLNAEQSEAIDNLQSMSKKLEKLDERVRLKIAA